VYFELSVMIARSPADVFAFLRDKDLYPQEPGSPVLVLDKTTDDPPELGTCYREVVQMLPLIRGEILSEITRYEPDRYLGEQFKGAGMQGHLLYEFVPYGSGTELIQRETLQPLGLLRLAGPLIERMLYRRLRERLQAIKSILESGWQVEAAASGTLPQIPNTGTMVPARPYTKQKHAEGIDEHRCHNTEFSRIDKRPNG
jgi:hypothetical protein